MNKFEQWYIEKYKFSVLFYNQMNFLEQNGLMTEFLAERQVAISLNKYGYYLVEMNEEGWRYNTETTNYHDALKKAIKYILKEKKHEL
jgi:hypothetical protein